MKNSLRNFTAGLALTATAITVPGCDNQEKAYKEQAISEMHFAIEAQRSLLKNTLQDAKDRQAKAADSIIISSPPASNIPVVEKSENKVVKVPSSEKPRMLAILVEGSDDSSWVSPNFFKNPPGFLISPLADGKGFLASGLSSGGIDLSIPSGVKASISFGDNWTEEIK